MRDPAQLDRLARGFAADVARGRVETAEIAQRIAAGANSAQAGQHKRKTLEQIVRDSGFSDAGELDAVLRIDGRAYR
jgi:hypothetical protein